MNYRNHSDDDIERIFYDEVRDKKRTGRGAFNKRGKGVKHKINGVKFPSDFLSKKEKKQLNGEMVVVSGLGKLISLDELNQLGEEKQKEVLAHWRKIYSTKVIMEQLGIEQNAYYKILYKLGVIPKPASYYEPKNPTENGVGLVGVSNRYAHLVDAKPEDVISRQEFEKLGDFEKYKLMEKYGEKYKTESIGDIWSMPKGRLYNIKYQLKKKLEKAGLLPTPEKKEREVKVNENKNESTINQSTEQAPPRIVVVTNTNEPQELENAQEQLTFGATEENEQVPVNPTTNNSQEISDLRELIFAQGKMFQDMMFTQQQLAASIEETKQTQQSMQLAQPVQPVHPVQSTPQAAMPTYVVDPMPMNKSEMVFSFEDQKEGFMLYQDIKRFISVIEKNPDIFNVEIKITRKEQQ